MQVYRIRQLATTKGEKGHDGLMPVSPATLWRWVKEGKFPAPFKLGPNVTVWDAEKVDQFLSASRSKATT
jgi:hypothetical protein